MKLSIITVCFNDLSGLKRTMQSILPLPEHCEWIVIDGASTDGTVEFFNDSSFDHKNISFISESDSGIFDAMNKGIRLSSGTYLNFMNSGDFYNREEFFSIASNINDYSSDILCFDYKCVDSALLEVNTNLLATSKSELCKRSSVPHQSALIKRKVFDMVGLYDQTFSHSGDYEFFARASKSNISFSFYPGSYLAFFVLDGLTSKNRSCLVQGIQHYKIQNKHFGSGSKKRFLIFFTRYIISFFPFSDSLISHARKLVFKGRL